MSNSSLPEAGARLTLSLDEWEKNWSSAMDDADTLTQALDDISGSVDVEVNLDVPDTSELDDIQALDGETISPELDTTETPEGKQVREGINFLATMKKIEVAINVIGTAIDFVKDIGAMAINPFLDIEDAVAKINAQTGGSGIADLGQLIRDIQAADLGTGVDQIASVLITAKQLGKPMEEAATAALSFTHTWTTEDPNTVLNTFVNMLDSGLVPSLQDAADLMTVFFQQGGNRAGDALSIVGANAQTWADMGLNGSQALSAINSLLDANVASATDAAKMIQTLDDALTTAADNADSPQAEALKTLGMTNPKDSGQAMGADFLDGFSASFSNLSSDQQDLISGVLFGKGGKKFTGALEGITTQQGPFADVVGAASDAATEIDNSLRGAIDDFVLAINTKIQDLLSSDSIDLPGKIAAIKEGLQKGIDVLANGGSIGDALEIGLNIPGLSDTLDTFIGNVERVFGNIGIILLQAVAAVQSLQGVDNTGTLAQISTMGQKQLAFDLQLANPDEVATMIDQAVQRGVTPDGIGTAMRTALTETINNGSLDDALNLADAMQASADRNGADASKVMEAWLAPFREIAQTKIQEAIDAAKPPVQTEGWWQNLKPPNDFLETALTSKDVGGKSTGNGWWTNFQPTADKSGDATAAFTDLQTKAETTMDAVSTAVSTASDESVASLEGLALQAQVADTDIATAMTGNTVTASFEAVATAADEAFPGVMDWFQRTSQAAALFDVQTSGHIQHLINLLHDLQFLSAQVSTGVQAALTLGSTLPGGGNTTNNNVTVNNNVNSQAGAVINGYAIGRSLRGG